MRSEDSSTSSATGFVNITDFITEETPISLPKERNQAIQLLQIRRKLCFDPLLDEPFCDTVRESIQIERNQLSDKIEPLSMTQVTNKMRTNYSNADIIRSSTPIRLSARAKEEFDENVGAGSSDEN
jgi:hypothetical protein